MSAINVRLPQSLHQALRDLAERDGVSLNQFITNALSEKVAAMMTESYLQERAQRGNRQKFEEALSHVADLEPDENDHL